MSAKKRHIILPGLLVLSTLAALALVSAKDWNVASAVDERSSSGTKTVTQFPAASIIEAAPSVTAHNEIVSARRESNDEPMEVEVITVRPNGFEPREITRPQGRFMLAINNHSGATELALQLDRVQGNRVHEVRLPKSRVRWNKVLNLPPGDYVLSEQNHPDWVCRIKLTAR
jgi:hypothetical protein